MQFLVHLSYVWNRVLAIYWKTDMITTKELPGFITTLIEVEANSKVRGLATDIAQYRKLAYFVSQQGNFHDQNELYLKEQHLKDIYAFTMTEEYEQLDRKFQIEVLTEMTDLDNSPLTISYWAFLWRSWNSRYKYSTSCGSAILYKKLILNEKIVPIVRSFAKTRLQAENEKYITPNFHNLLDVFERQVESDVAAWPKLNDNIALKSWIDFRLDLKGSILDYKILNLFKYAKEYAKFYHIMEPILDYIIIVQLDAFFFDRQNNK